MVFLTNKLHTRKRTFMDDMIEKQAARINEQEHTISQMSDEIRRMNVTKDLMEQRHKDDGNILSNLLFYVFSECGLERHHLLNAIANNSYNDIRIYEVLTDYCAVPEDLLVTEYNVSVTVPVTVTISVRAKNADDAEEQAMYEINDNGLENYYMDYNVDYNGEFEVEEV